jgi:hypothetical protein
LLQFTTSTMYWLAFWLKLWLIEGLIPGRCTHRTEAANTNLIFFAEIRTVTQVKHVNYYTLSSWFLSKMNYTCLMIPSTLNKVFPLPNVLLYFNYKNYNVSTVPQNYGKLLNLYWRKSRWKLNPISKNIQRYTSCTKLVFGLCYILIILTKRELFVPFQN